MTKVFITGSSDGLGLLAARDLLSANHEVVLHARNEKRRQDTFRLVQGVSEVLVGDLESPEETIRLAHNVNALGRFDAIIHNAGVYQASSDTILKVNSLAPYILTSVITKPDRLVYLSSGMHQGGHFQPDIIRSGQASYSDSKLHNLLLSLAVARKWKGVLSNAVDPGWVPTRMGGRNAPDNLDEGYQTQTWLAVSQDEKALVSGKYFYHKSERRHSSTADSVEIQEEFLTICHQLTGVLFPQ